MNNPIDQIQSYYEDLTKTDRDIAIYIINNPQAIVTTRLDKLAKEINTSKSALSRFAQRIGYPGFSEFRYEMGRFLVSSSSGDEDEPRDPISVISKTYADYIGRLPELLDRQQIERIARIMTEARILRIFGINRSGNAALQMKQRLIRIGFENISSESDTSTISDLLASSKKEDVIVIFSTTDNTGFYSSNFKDVKAKTVFITANPNLPFRKRCDEYVVIPRISRDSYASFLDDQAIFLVLIEILIEAIVRESNLTNKR